MNSRQFIRRARTRIREAQPVENVMALATAGMGIYCARLSIQSYQRRTEARTLEEQIGRDINALTPTYTSYWTTQDRTIQTYIQQQYDEHLQKVQDAQPRAEHAGIKIEEVIRQGLHGNINIKSNEATIHLENSKRALEEERQLREGKTIQEIERTPTLSNITIPEIAEMKRYKEQTQKLEYEVRTTNKEIRRAESIQDTIVNAGLSIALITTAIGMYIQFKKKRKIGQTFDIDTTKGYTM